MFGGGPRVSLLPPRSRLADPWKEKSIARQEKEPLGNSAEQAGNNPRGEMGREGISTNEGLTPGKPRLAQEFLDGLRGEVAQVIGDVVKAIWNAEQSQKVLDLSILIFYIQTDQSVFTLSSHACPVNVGPCGFQWIRLQEPFRT